METPSTTPPQLSPEQQKIADEACDFVRQNKKMIIERFAGDDFPPAEHPVSFFMAGSPGAGKTEFSRRLIMLQSGTGAGPIVRIDGDEIRGLLPGYVGGNAYLFQRAISIGVSKIHNYALKKNKNFILDGTFSRLEKARENLNRSIKASRGVIVVYVYQEPLIAWKFTQKREVEEGRSIPKDVFIERFLGAWMVVQAIKKDFGDSIKLWLVEKNLETNFEKISLNISGIDAYIPKRYSKEELESILKQAI